MSNTPYCRTCHKAGKSYWEYTNHWTRDKPGKDGNIVCPVILNTICTYCKEKGHWVKYCPHFSKKQPDTETHNQPIIQSLNSWANILKRGLLPHTKYKQTINNHIIYDRAGKGFDYNNCMSIDVSICDIEELSRPPSPDYPPPPPLYRSTTPDYPPPPQLYRSTTPDYPPPSHHV